LAHPLSGPNADQLEQQRNRNPILQALHKRLKNQEADDGGLDEKENCVGLMIAFVSRDRGDNQPSEIKDTAQKVDRS
jgi:hypothetical protein